MKLADSIWLVLGTWHLALDKETGNALVNKNHNHNNNNNNTLIIIIIII